MAEHRLLKISHTRVQSADQPIYGVKVCLFHNGKWIDITPIDHPMIHKTERYQSILYDHCGEKRIMLIFHDGSVFSLNLRTMKVHELQSMLKARSDLGVTQMNGRIYVAGGIADSPEGFIPTDTVEEYDPETNVWKSFLSLPKPRYLVYLLNVNNVMYAVGDRWDKKSVFYFDSNTNIWIQTTSMFESLDDFEDYTATVYQDKIVAVAIQHSIGWDPNILECMDVNQKTWSKFSSFPCRIEHAKIFIHQNQMYLGGYNGYRSSNLLKYDDNLKEWTDTTEFGNDFETFAEHFSVPNYDSYLKNCQ